MDKTGLSCRDFVAEVASSAPAPGGGGAAALCAAIGAALAHMVGTYTVGKPRYAAVEEEVQAVMYRLEKLTEELQDQVEADEKGFMPLAKAYRIPKDDPERPRILEEATVTACAVPLRIMELAAAAVDCAGVMARKGSALAVSDAGCAASILKGAMDAAALNLFINTKSMKDRNRAEELNARCLALLEESGKKAEEIYEEVKAGLLPEKQA